MQRDPASTPCGHRFGRRRRCPRSARALSDNARYRRTVDCPRTRSTAKAMRKCRCVDGGRHATSASAPCQLQAVHRCRFRPPTARGRPATGSVATAARHARVCLSPSVLQVDGWRQNVTSAFMPRISTVSSRTSPARRAPASRASLDTGGPRSRKGKFDVEVVAAGVAAVPRLGLRPGEE